MSEVDACDLARLVNAYTVERSPKSLTVPKASKLAAYRDVTVTGTLLPRRIMEIEADGNTRTAKAPSKLGDKYPMQADGDVHFGIGCNGEQEHVACEIQKAKGFWHQKINESIGNPVTVAGFFRCLFEHPGFSAGADAHIFEIHPVRAVDFGDGHGLVSLDVEDPEPDSIHKWIDKTKKRDLNKEDAKTQVAYDPGTDELTFSGMKGMDLNYVRLRGTVSDIQLNSNTEDPATFTFDSPQITDYVTVSCLKATGALFALEGLENRNKIEMVALRNIDLSEAMNGNYVISLLAISIEKV
jgi:hypothetical protein